MSSQAPVPEQPNPLEVIVPPYEGADQDTEQLHQEHIKLVDDESLMQWALRDYKPRAVDPKQLPKGKMPEPPGEGSMAARAAKDVGIGVVEMPVQLAGGALDAANETIDLIAEFQGSLPPPEEMQPVLPGVGVEPPIDFRALGRLPTTPEAQTTTGDAIRSVSQFLTGFAGAGKLKPIQWMAGKGKGGAYLADAMKGAVSDFTVFDSAEEGLSNMIQEVPALANPVNEYLALEEDDPAVVKRLKRAVEGVGLGLTTDAAKKLMQGLKIVRASRRARKQLGDAAEQADALLKQAEKTTQIQQKRLAELQGGTPTQPVVRKAKPAADGATAPDDSEIFINWSRTDTEDDIKAAIQELADADAARINEARRGKVSHAQTRLDAETVDAWETLKSRRKGQPLGDAESVKVRNLWVASGKHVVEMAAQVKASPEDVPAAIAFRKALAVHSTIQEQVIAARTETARALASWRIPVGGTLDFQAQMDAMEAAVQSEGKSTKALAEGVLNLSAKGRARELDAFVYGSNFAKGQNAIRQLWYFSLLSGPHTHVRNTLSQAAVMMQQVYERKVANLLGKVDGDDPSVVDGEALAYLYALREGIVDAFRTGAKNRSAFKEALMTGRSQFGVGKIELPDTGAFDPEVMGVTRDSPLGRVLSFIDTGTRIPTRALAASDEVFKSAGYRAELHALSLRQATQEMRSGKITSDQFMDRVAELKSNPAEQMMLAARMHADEVTFSKNPKDSKIYTWMRNTQNVPVIGRIAMPFARTPYNIGNYVFKRTPLGLAMKSVQADLKAGGARADQAYARVLTGSGILLTFADMAMRGQITGEGPRHSTERQTLMRTEWRPYSVKIGDKYYPYRGLEPIATSLGLAANISEILSMADFGDDNKDLDDIAIAASFAIANQVTSQQYMSGVAGFIEAMSDPARYGEHFINRTLGAVVPTGVAQVNRALLDPVQREVVDAIDVIRSRTPGLSDDMSIKYDVWARPMSYSSHMGPLADFLIPIHASNTDSEPIDTESIRLGSYVGWPDRLVTFQDSIGESVAINLENYPAAYSRYVQLAGNELKAGDAGIDYAMPGAGAKDLLNAMVTGKHPLSFSYQMEDDGPDGGKAKIIKAYVDDFRAAAKERLLKEFPELKARVESQRLARAAMEAR